MLQATDSMLIYLVILDELNASFVLSKKAHALIKYVIDLL